MARCSIGAPASRSAVNTRHSSTIPDRDSLPFSSLWRLSRKLTLEYDPAAAHLRMAPILEYDLPPGRRLHRERKLVDSARPRPSPSQRLLFQAGQPPCQRGGNTQLVSNAFLGRALIERGNTVRVSSLLSRIAVSRVPLRLCMLPVPRKPAASGLTRYPVLG